MIRSIYLALALITLGMTASVRSEVFTFDFTGEVNLVFGRPFSGGIWPRVGDSVVEGTFTYDTDVPEAPRRREVTYATYYQSPLNNFALTLRGVTMASDGYTMTVGNNVPDSLGGYDAFDIFDNDGSILMGNQSAPGYIQLHLNDRSATVFSNDRVPANLELQRFGFRYGEMWTVVNGVASGVTFSVTSLIAIPEPAPISLLMSVLGGGIVIRMGGRALRFGASNRPR